MAKDALIEALEEDAAVQRRRITEEAEELSREIIKEARSDAAAQRDARLKDLRSMLEKRKAARVNAARVTASAEALKAMHSVMDGVFKEAVDSFKPLSAEGRAALVRALYSELLASWQAVTAEKPVVLLNPADAGLIEGAVADRSVESGAALVSRDGRVRFENTISSRLERARQELVMRLDAVLFGGL